MPRTPRTSPGRAGPDASDKAVRRAARSAADPAAEVPTAQPTATTPHPAAPQPAPRPPVVLPAVAPSVAGTTVGRFPVLDVSPVVDGGRRPAKAVEGEWVPVRAIVVRDGHDALGVSLVLAAPDGSERVSRLDPTFDGNDGWTGGMRPDSPGRWTFWLEAWHDPYETWRHRAEVKVPAGLDVELELAEGALVLERAMKALPRGKVREPFKAAVAALRDTTRPGEARLAVAVDPVLVATLRTRPLRDLVAASAAFPLTVERRRALVGSWYEFFPRSEGASLDPLRSGTFATAAERLPAVADMGFDVVYLPPIHPIGTTFRKGPNNSLTPGPRDPGVPWAIGSSEGGHDAVHPDLGTIEDFDAFVARTRGLGMEVALDLALQASPDHPWVSEHPDWFVHRLDGTIAYAENPPKKYQDIYPLTFDLDPEGLYAEVERIVRHWMAHGVRIFRVDNPHTKPVWVWERLIGAISATDPDVIFLAEAFTRPPMMRTLAEVGFQQSYTYFTWRSTKWELEDYLGYLAGPASAFMRPNFFVNTPDILPENLQHGGPAAFAVRAVLAATLSPTWGVYTGFELYEHESVRPGSEEYLDSEKYQYRPRDWQSAEAEGRTLAPFLAVLNEARRRHPALQTLRGITFHATDDPDVIAYSRRDGGTGPDDDPDVDTVVVVVNLNPRAARETMVHLHLPALGLAPGTPFAAHDLISGETWRWGDHQYVRLEPWENVAHVVHVRRLP